MRIKPQVGKLETLDDVNLALRDIGLKEKELDAIDAKAAKEIAEIKTKAAKDGEYRLDFLRARCRYGEIYVDGVLIDQMDDGMRGGYVSAPFTVKAGTTHDIRILLYVEDGPAVGSGISGRVEMKETK